MGDVEQRTEGVEGERYEEDCEIFWERREIEE